MVPAEQAQVSHRMYHNDTIVAESDHCHQSDTVPGMQAQVHASMQGLVNQFCRTTEVCRVFCSAGIGMPDSRLVANFFSDAEWHAWTECVMASLTIQLYREKAKVCDPGLELQNACASSDVKG